MRKILQDSYNQILNEVQRNPLFLFFDGLTSSNDIITKNLKMYSVFADHEQIYFNDTFELVDGNNRPRTVKVKGITLNNFLNNKKYKASFVLANVENNFAVTNDSVIEKINPVFKKISFKEVIKVIKDKIYNNTIKLEKENQLTEYAKELCLVNIRLIEIATSLFEEPNFITATAKAREITSAKANEMKSADATKTYSDMINFFKQIVASLNNLIDTNTKKII